MRSLANCDFADSDHFQQYREKSLNCLMSKVKCSVLDIYLLKQLLLLFVLTVALLSGVGVSLGMLSELAYQISNYNLPLVVAIKIFCYKIPEYVAYGLPIGTLLTSLIVYGRLNSDRELVALQSFGISLHRVVLPGLLFSVVVSLLTFVFNEAIVPQANHRVALWRQAFLPETALSLERKDIFFPEYATKNTGEQKLKRLYYVESSDGQSLRNLTIFNWNSNGLEQIIVAQKARWLESQKLWLLENGFSDRLDRQFNIAKNQRTFFQRQQVKLPQTLFQVIALARDPYSMSISEAKTYLSLISQSNNEREIRLFKTRIQQKLAFPSICTIFALVGSALGMTFSNLSRGQSFTWCVAIVFIYYLLGFVIGSLGIAGAINPLLAAWLPNAIGLAYGAWLWQSHLS